MDEQTGGGVRTHRPADLPQLAGIEDSGGAQYREHFGDAIEPVLLAPASTGRWRAAQPGFLLVYGEPPVGFVHVLDLDGHAHLEQISVRPEHQRQGIGASLIRAAMAEARRRGYDALSLCTYRDVQWNGPYYASLGFEEVAKADLAPYQRRLAEKERDLRLDVNGVRIVMSIALG